MLLILFFLTAGMAVGYFLRKRDGIIKLADNVTTGAICFLLFLLGLSVGGNEIIINSIAKLGVQALVLTAGAVSGSVIISYFVYVYAFRRRGK